MRFFNIAALGGIVVLMRRPKGPRVILLCVPRQGLWSLGYDGGEGVVVVVVDIMVERFEG